ncbi:uncharacterized protein METZ01_LOCUS83156, partial [marine metagenome]
MKNASGGSVAETALKLRASMIEKTIHCGCPHQVDSTTTKASTHHPRTSTLVPTSSSIDENVQLSTAHGVVVTQRNMGGPQQPTKCFRFTSSDRLSGLLYTVVFSYVVAQAPPQYIVINGCKMFLLEI